LLALATLCCTVAFQSVSPPCAMTMVPTVYAMAAEREPRYPRTGPMFEPQAWHPIPAVAIGFVELAR
ncbi:hypothetical protein, partial [Gemmatimonas sp.]|uniref:hypothetical protein n=1 Tax=Gemmatimonas sp. TaxID=1962908 RepID=UPI0037C0E712